MVINTYRFYESFFSCDKIWGHVQKLTSSSFPGAKCGHLLNKLRCILYFKCVNRIESTGSEFVLFTLSVYMNDYAFFSISFDCLTFLFSSYWPKFENKIQCYCYYTVTIQIVSRQFSGFDF